MAIEFYTDEILDANFGKVTQFSTDVVEAMQSLVTLAERYETRLSVLEKLSARPVVVKSSKVLILTAMGISAYAGYKYAEKKITDQYEYKRSKTDHPAGHKQPNDTANYSPNEN